MFDCVSMFHVNEYCVYAFIAKVLKSTLTAGLCKFNPPKKERTSKAYKFIINTSSFPVGLTEPIDHFTNIKKSV